MFILAAALKLLIAILDFYSFFLMAWVIISLLMHFGVINQYNRLVKTISHFLDSIIEPSLRPIRKILPLFGSVDLSPLVLYLAIGFLQNLLVHGLVNMSNF